MTQQLPPIKAKDIFMLTALGFFYVVATIFEVIEKIYNKIRGKKNE